MNPRDKLCFLNIQIFDEKYPLIWRSCKDPSDVSSSCYDVIYAASRINCLCDEKHKKEFRKQLDKVDKFCEKDKFLSDLFRCKI